MKAGGESLEWNPAAFSTSLNVVLWLALVSGGLNIVIDCVLGSRLSCAGGVLGSALCSPLPHALELKFGVLLKRERTRPIGVLAAVESISVPDE